MIEAGHRCAIPTCRAIGPLEIEHIDEWAKVRKHEFVNMIVLCANCHGRKGVRRGEIDKKALRQYKESLAVLNSRYGEFERRILDYFAAWNSLPDLINRAEELERTIVEIKKRAQEVGEALSERDRTQIAAFESALGVSANLKVLNKESPTVVSVARGFSFHLFYLVHDGYLRLVKDHPKSLRVDEIAVIEVYELTERGKKFVDRWKSAGPLDV